MREKAKSKAIDAALFGYDLIKLSTHFGEYHVIGWKGWGEGQARGYVCEWKADPKEIIQEHEPLTLRDALLLIDQFGDSQFEFTAEISSPVWGEGKGAQHG